MQAQRNIGGHLAKRNDRRKIAVQIVRPFAGRLVVGLDQLGQQWCEGFGSGAEVAPIRNGCTRRDQRAGDVNRGVHHVIVGEPSCLIRIRSGRQRHRDLHALEW